MSLNKKVVISFLYPFLFVLFPLLHLYSTNFSSVGFQTVLLVIIKLLFLTLLLWFVFFIIYKNSAKVSFFIFLFYLFSFSYGYIVTERVLVSSVNSVLLLLLAGLTIVVYFLLIFIRIPQVITQFLTVFSLFLVISVVAKVLMTGALLKYEGQVISKEPVSTSSVLSLSASKYPDIYYIILDAHGSDQSIRNHFSLEDYSFSSDLESRGFYVPLDSVANYAITPLSLASSLNFSYIQDILPTKVLGSRNLGPLTQLIYKNQVTQELKNFGYKIITYKSLSAGKDIYSDISYGGYAPQDFELAFLMLTPLKAFDNGSLILDSYKSRTLEVLDSLGGESSEDGPVFVYAHILAPHPPFIFDSLGNDSEVSFNPSDLVSYSGTREDYMVGYREQVQYLDDKVLELVDRILERNPNSVIVLQGDHGSAVTLDDWRPTPSFVRERFSILNAFYFPEGSYGDLKRFSSPVNTFRVIFNKYFEKNYSLVESRCYFSTYENLYEFKDVTNEVN